MYIHYLIFATQLLPLYIKGRIKTGLMLQTQN
jgi:hypothetical protein